jgi:hypothetical protein
VKLNNNFDHQPRAFVGWNPFIDIEKRIHHEFRVRDTRIRQQLNKRILRQKKVKKKRKRYFKSSHTLRQSQSFSNRRNSPSPCPRFWIFTKGQDLYPFSSHLGDLLRNRYKVLTNLMKWSLFPRLHLSMGCE